MISRWQNLCNQLNLQFTNFMNDNRELIGEVDFIIIIIDNRGLNALWCLTPLLLSLLTAATAAYLGQRGLPPAGLPHTPLLNVI